MLPKGCTNDPSGCGVLMGLSNSSNLNQVNGALLQYAAPLIVPTRAALAFPQGFTPDKIQVYHNDVVIKFTGKRPDHLDGSQRQKITKLSYKSLQALAFTASNTEATFESILTLTYPKIYPADGKIVKKHLNRILKCLRPTSYSYLWFLEFQRRGAPHLHILLSQRVGHNSQRWISKRWYEIVGSEDPKHLAAGTNWENVRKADGAKRYAIKYATKPDQKQVPVEFQNVGRFWGCSRSVKPQMKREVQITHPRQIEKTLAGWEWISRCDPNVKIRYNAAAAANDYLDNS